MCLIEEEEITLLSHVLCFWFHNKTSVAEGQIFYKTLRSHADKIMKCKGVKSVANTYISIC